MKKETAICVFGEVLFDVFPDGQEVLGGAPFNVAWHLQALGDKPLFISRVGRDQPGHIISTAMQDWHMATMGLQYDDMHPSGRVEVRFEDDEPHYTIVPDCAYDFIAKEFLPEAEQGLLYHGTLALRNETSRKALAQLKQKQHMAVFVDVNLRTPWWQKVLVQDWLTQARYAKLNEEELKLLGNDRLSVDAAAQDMVQRYNLEQLIVTCGAAGAFVCTDAGDIETVQPRMAATVVDTVGAGDAFTAVYLHGLLQGWSVTKTLQAAQEFACKVVSLRGATSREESFYQDFLNAHCSES